MNLSDILTADEYVKCLSQGKIKRGANLNKVQLSKSRTTADVDDGDENRFLMTRVIVNESQSFLETCVFFNFNSDFMDAWRAKRKTDDV